MKIPPEVERAMRASRLGADLAMYYLLLQVDFLLMLGLLVWLFIGTAICREHGRWPHPLPKDADFSWGLRATYWAAWWPYYLWQGKPQQADSEPEMPGKDPH